MKLREWLLSTNSNPNQIHSVSYSGEAWKPAVASQPGSDCRRFQTVKRGQMWSQDEAIIGMRNPLCFRNAYPNNDLLVSLTRVTTRGMAMKIEPNHRGLSVHIRAIIAFGYIPLRFFFLFSTS